jgi:hypothetical protein
MKFPANVISFAQNEKNLAVYQAFRDYWYHYQDMTGFKNELFDRSKTFAEKESAMNDAMRREVFRVAGVSFSAENEISDMHMANHPMIQWATYAVIDNMIDTVLPDSVIRSVGMYSEVRTIGYGDTAKFIIKPRDLFKISKSGQSQRFTENHQQFSTEVTLNAEARQLTVGGISLYHVLTGRDSLAELVSKVIRSFESELMTDIYNAFHAAMIALPSTDTTGLYVSGYTQDSLTRLCEQVSSWNAAPAAIVGTKRALVNVLPTDANYRFGEGDDLMKVGYLSSAFGYPLLALPQVAKWQTPFDTLLSNSYLYILSPGAQKFVKVVLEGSTQSYTNSHYDTANLTQSATFWKSWGVGVVTSAVAGCIAL